ncbi:uncharacterized protein LOC133186626 [Saccostrea echinata]|uniref:uncharacterized protein LOC133186626 n=1 Tax=Saccostrea echinata TaxID=191078 RepID=UPI002A80C3F3|nr:uncharacterized protein LOC133186626 [Saccostrea echinata]
MLQFPNIIHVDQTVHVDARPYIRMNDSNHVVGYTIGNLTNFSSVNITPSSGPEPLPPKWGVLAIVLIVFCTAIGNLLVCIAVIWDRRLQNMTNYFLMSLAIADFLVSILVMPFGMLVELFGNFPLRPEFCIFWVTTDVLMCTASIWHMCTMSMDRYFTLKYPMKYGRNKTKMTVALKILFAWLVSITISSPICFYGISDTNSVFNEGQCVPAIQDFVIYGSIFAFYIPLTIMLVTYILTIRILWRNQKLMKIDRSDTFIKSRLKHGEICEMKSLLHPQPEDGDRSNDTDATVLGTQLNTPRHDDKSPQNQLSLLNEDPAVSSNQENSLIQTFHSKYSIKCANDPKQDKETEMVQIKISKSISRSGNVQKAGEMKLEQKASSLSCLKATHYDYPSYSSMCTKSPKSHLLLPSRGDNFLRLSSHDSLVKRSTEKSCLHQAVSCSTVNTTSSILSNLIPCSGNSHFHSCSDIGKKDLKLVEWKENYSKIQKEMDQILKGDFDKEDLKSSRQSILAQAKSSSSDDSIWNKEISDDETYYDSHENSSNKKDCTETDVKHLRQIIDNRDKNAWDETDSTSDALYWSTSQLLPRTEASQQFSTTINNTFFPKCDTETSLLNSKHTSGNENPSQCLCASRQQSHSSINISISSQQSMPLSDSGDSIIDPSDVSDNSESLTIKLRPTTLQMYKFTTKSPSPSSPLIGSGSKIYGGSGHQLCNGTGKHNGQAGHKMINRSLTINKLLSKFNKNQGASPVMSKRATTNERKASKVLGIIFAVFVILWTPFFIVNILSVTCQHCMQNVTPELMSLFQWMGYMASLANPIIYTMFNTSFRRAFIRILKCHICINGSLRAADRSTMSYPMSFTERRKHGGQISVNYHHHHPL